MPFPFTLTKGCPDWMSVSSYDILEPSVSERHHVGRRPPLVTVVTVVSTRRDGVRLIFVHHHVLATPDA